MAEIYTINTNKQSRYNYVQLRLLSDSVGISVSKYNSYEGSSKETETFLDRDQMILLATQLTAYANKLRSM